MNTLANVITIIAISLGIAFLILMAFIFYRRRGVSRNPFEDMEGEEFERYCADVLSRRGFHDIQMTPKSHDYGIDILAEYQEITYAIQCKCYSEPVGIKAVQEAYAGKDYYDKMIGVVMTNGSFTKNAIHFANKLHVLLWDKKDIYKMISYYGNSNGAYRKEVTDEIN